MIELYTTSSSNGFKATIALVELALPYELHYLGIAPATIGDQALC